MKVLHLSAGAGPMYCGSCLHSNTLAAALGRLGVEVLLVPVYTPLRTDEESTSSDRLAMGGINVYLQHEWGARRWLPRFVARLLDRPGLVRWVARRGTRTRPARLGPLTVSVLRGHEGLLGHEVEKLAAWLAAEVRPDLIHLSNAMLAGLVPALRAKWPVPVVCTLSGEDSFLEKLPPPYAAEARAVLRQRAAAVDAWIAMNDYYAGFMADYLAVPPERIHVIPPGLNLQGHRAEGGRREDEGSRMEDEGCRPPAASQRRKTIGYLGRICPDKGLHLLLEAVRPLADDRSVPAFRVRAAGYLDPAERPYLAGLLAEAAARGLGERFEYLGELDRPAKIAFLQSLDVMTAPAVLPESKGLTVLEAWANGVPTVLPAHGAFPEMVRDTGGGLLFPPGSVGGLAAALGRMLREGSLAEECGRRAHQAVHHRYGAERMARQTLELYEILHRAPLSRRERDPRGAPE
ncbi:MAG: glycosyltransferase family 4 protein [Thermoguttaceae bacterium]|jgi:glycosyltransferase involved in cell wall biosynthesis